MQEKELQALNTLEKWGVPFLSSPLAKEDLRLLELDDLLSVLIQSRAGRLRLAITAFFLVHPEKALVVFRTLSVLKKKPRLLLEFYYTAAVYLQELWKTQLAHFGTSRLPDYFSHKLELPEPAQFHGRLGLASLEEMLQQLVCEPYNYQASFESLIRLLESREEFCETTCESPTNSTIP